MTPVRRCGNVLRYKLLKVAAEISAFSFRPNCHSHIHRGWLLVDWRMAPALAAYVSVNLVPVQRATNLPKSALQTDHFPASNSPAILLRRWRHDSQAVISAKARIVAMAFVTLSTSILFSFGTGRGIGLFFGVVMGLVVVKYPKLSLSEH